MSLRADPQELDAVGGEMRHLRCCVGPISDARGEERLLLKVKKSKKKEMTMPGIELEGRG